MPHGDVLDADVQILRRENARLSSENNALHQKLIDSADKYDQHARKTAAVIRRLENELHERQFLQSQSAERIRAEQRRLDDERRRIDNAFRTWKLWDSGKSIGRDPGQRIELAAGGLAPLETPAWASNRAPQLVDPYVVDMVKLAEAQAREQRAQVEDLEMRNADLEMQIGELKAQLSTREAEIHRLSSLMQSAKNPERAGREQRLEAQIDFLQQQIQDLEQKLENKGQSNDRELDEARNHNARLTRELAELEARYLALCENSDYLSHQAVYDEVEALRELLKTSNQTNEELALEYEKLLAAKPSNPQPAASAATVPATVPPATTAPPPAPSTQQPPAAPESTPVSPPPPTAAEATSGVPPPSSHPPPVVQWAIERELAETREKLREATAQLNQLNKLKADQQDLEDQMQAYMGRIRELERARDATSDELRQVTEARDALLVDLRSLDEATQTLSQQIATVVEERNNFESLYLQLLDRDADTPAADASAQTAEPAPQHVASCSSCSAKQLEVLAHAQESARLQQELSQLLDRTRDWEAKATAYGEVNAKLVASERQVAILQSSLTQVNTTVQQQLAILQQQAHELAEAKKTGDRLLRDAGELQHLHAEAAQLRSEVAQLQGHLNEANNVVSQRLAQVNRLHQQLQEVELEKKNMTIEVNNVATDLTSLIKENQLLNSELEDAAAERAQLTATIQQLQSQVHEQHESMRRADHDRQQTMINYKKLLAQLDGKSETQQVMQGAVDQLHMEIRMRDHRIVQLTGSLDQLRGRYEATLERLAAVEATAAKQVTAASTRVPRDSAGPLSQPAPLASPEVDHSQCEATIRKYQKQVETLRNERNKLDVVLKEERARAQRKDAELAAAKSQLQSLAVERRRREFAATVSGPATSSSSASGGSKVEAMFASAFARTRAQMDSLASSTSSSSSRRPSPALPVLPTVALSSEPSTNSSGGPSGGGGLPDSTPAPRFSRSTSAIAGAGAVNQPSTDSSAATSVPRSAANTTSSTSATTNTPQTNSTGRSTTSSAVLRDYSALRHELDNDPSLIRRKQQILASQAEAQAMRRSISGAVAADAGV
ncbi:hypothetical protein H9P43_002283 [Blastocladiella emersonii ATCC 22665]|nr:hypothetical protein H9P43_002283 [Blastocladiella emersonii ATCC 22665]